MDPESKKILEETLSLAEENNKMLHKIRSVQKWASFMRIMYWLIIIGVSVGSFYFLQPYVNELKNMIEATGSTFEQFKNLIPNSR